MVAERRRRNIDLRLDLASGGSFGPRLHDVTKHGEADGVAVIFDDAEPLGLVTLPDVLTRLRRDEELGRAPAVAA